MGVEDIPRTIWWARDENTDRPAVCLIDQTRLPLQGDVLSCATLEGVCVAIASLAVRGAPALGVAAALALALWSENESAEAESVDDYLAGLEEAARQVSATRPTAVNLAWGAERILKAARDNADLGLEALKKLVIQEALNMAAEDEERNRRIGANGAELLPADCKLLTHCNAGSIATAFFGTALGVIFTAHEQGKVAHVWVDETRPVNQGGRLTMWELRLAGIPSALIVDSAAAMVMKQGLVDAVIVGADRIAANGDTANKIGTYGLAVLARAHGVPFYVAAPTSTIDLTLPSGDGIVIEERDPREVGGFTVSGTFEADTPSAGRAFDALTEKGPYDVKLLRGHRMTLSRKGGAYSFDAWFRMTPPSIQVYNPAFDVTPAEYVTAFITERGVVRGGRELAEPELRAALQGLCRGSGALDELTAQSPRTASPRSASGGTDGR
ncbi:MAG: S-methyl-5-thioribose-1-phosphate isomerase [Coriobacteriia bacterium]